MEQVRIDFFVAANMSSMSSQLQGINAELMRTGAAAAALQKGLNSIDFQTATRGFNQLLASSGQFNTQTVTMRNSTTDYANALQRAKLSGRQYFTESMRYLRGQSGAIRDLANQQIRLQNSVVTPLGRNAMGQMQTAVATPTGLPLDTATSLRAANKGWEVFNVHAQQGATHMVNMGKNTQWAGRQLMVGFTVPMMMLGGLAAKAFKDLDEELVRLQKVYGSGLTFGDEFAAQSKIVREAGIQMAQDMAQSYGQAGTETVALMADLAAIGLEGEELAKMTEQTTRLSVLGEVDRQESMKATVAMQSAFKMSTDEVAESVLFLNAVENATSATLNDLVEAIPRAGTVVKGLGGNMEDLALYMVAMREGGISAAEGANALKSGLSSVIAPPKAAVEFLNDLGINLPKIVDTNAGDLTGTLLELQKGLAGLDGLSRQRAITTLFGKYQFARMNAFFNNLGAAGSQTQDVLRLTETSVADLAKTADQELEAIAESVSGKWTRAWEEFKISLSGAGEEMMKWGTRALGVVNSVFGFISDNSWLQGIIKYGAMALTVIGPIIMVMGLFGNMVGMLLKGIIRLVNGFKVLASGKGISRTFQMLTADTLQVTQGFDMLDREMYDHKKAQDVVTQGAREWAIAMEGVTAATLETVAAVEVLTKSKQEQTMAGTGLSGPMVRGHIIAEAPPESQRAMITDKFTGLTAAEKAQVNAGTHYPNLGKFGYTMVSAESNKIASNTPQFFAGTKAGPLSASQQAAAIDANKFFEHMRINLTEAGVQEKKINDWEMSATGKIGKLQADVAAGRVSALQAEMVLVETMAGIVDITTMKQRGVTSNVMKKGSDFDSPTRDAAASALTRTQGVAGSISARDQMGIVRSSQTAAAALDQVAVETKKLSVSQIKTRSASDLAKAQFEVLARTNAALAKSGATLIAGSVAHSSTLKAWTTTIQGEIADLNADDVIFQKMAVAGKDYAVALNKATGQVLSVRGYNTNTGHIGKEINTKALSVEVKAAADAFAAIVVKSAQTVAAISDASSKRVATMTSGSASDWQSAVRNANRTEAQGAQAWKTIVIDSATGAARIQTTAATTAASIEVGGAIVEEKIETSGGVPGSSMGMKGMGIAMAASMIPMMIPTGDNQAAGTAMSALSGAGMGAMMGSFIPGYGTAIGAVLGATIAIAPAVNESLSRGMKEASEDFKNDFILQSAIMGEALSKDIGEAFDVKKFRPDEIFRDVIAPPDLEGFENSLMTSSQKFSQKVSESFATEIEAIKNATSEGAATASIQLYDKLLLSGFSPDKASKIIQSIILQAEKQEIVIDVVANIREIKTGKDARQSLVRELESSRDNLEEGLLDQYGLGWFNSGSHQAEAEDKTYKWGQVAGEAYLAGASQKVLDDPEKMSALFWEKMLPDAQVLADLADVDWGEQTTELFLERNGELGTAQELFGLTGDLEDDIKTIYGEWGKATREEFFNSFADGGNTQQFLGTMRSDLAGAADEVAKSFGGMWDDRYWDLRDEYTGAKALEMVLGEMAEAADDVTAKVSAMDVVLGQALGNLYIPEYTYTPEDIEKREKAHEKEMAQEERRAERQREAIDEERERLDERMSMLDEEIDKVNRVFDKEVAQIERVEEKRQEAFAKEEERFAKRQQMRNMQISYDEAIANGQLYEAARIRMDMAAIKKQDDAESKRERSARRAEDRIAAIERERKAELKLLEAKKKSIEKQQELLDDQADAIDDHLEAVEDSHKAELKSMKETYDKEIEETQRVTDRIQKIWENASLSIAERIRRIIGVVGNINKEEAKSFIKTWEDTFGQFDGAIQKQLVSSLKSGNWKDVYTTLADAVGIKPGDLDEMMSILQSGFDFKVDGDGNIQLGGGNASSKDRTAGMPEATGGYISGPGTGTSDSIKARLSNGEYVVRQRSVAKYGKGAMDAVNAGNAQIIPKFATGGLVQAVGSALSGQAAGLMMNNMLAARFMMDAMAASGNATGVAGSTSATAGKPGEYSGTFFNAEQLKNAAIIAGVGKSMGANKRDILTALATAMTESTLHNYKTAVDHDSLGLFQQRPSMGWGTPEQLTDPKYASRKFYQALFGISNRDQMSIGDAAQDVQVSAYPDRYQEWVDEARAILKSISYKEGYVKPWMGSHGYSRTFGQHGGQGVDISMPTGTPLRAVTGGRLTNQPFAFGSYGNWYTLDNDGLQFVYAHLDRDKAGSGPVSPGDIIGYSGNTGNSFGAHLHFEARRNGLFSDQMDPARLGIPGLRSGGRINYDNTLANLHRGETVLTRQLSDKFENNVASAGGNTYNFDVSIGEVKSEVDLERAFERFVVRHENRQAARNGRGRRI